MNKLPLDLTCNICNYDPVKYKMQNKLVRQINVIFGEYNKIYNACLEIIMKSDSIQIEELNKNCWTDSHSKFILKYAKEPHKYILDSNKRKELSFWY